MKKYCVKGCEWTPCAAVKPLIPFLLLALCHFASAQDNGFAYGSVTMADISMKKYDRDSLAPAVVLKEFGEAYIDDRENSNLVFVYHVRIKILTQEGIAKATVDIPLYKSSDESEKIISIQGSSFNLENGVVKETKLEAKNVFTENVHKQWDLKKFALPNVHVGSVIEYKYTLESPYVYKFRKWVFQQDIPKITSEYWALIPGTYSYNITLRGFLNLSQHESDIVRQCAFAGRADCVRNKYRMDDIPAFAEEDYVTAPSNFISAINFELAEVKHLDGRVTKYTEEWRDAEQKLRTHEKFGFQLKRGKDIAEDAIAALLAGETDSLKRAQKIHAFIRDWYTWDERDGIFSEFGINRAFESKYGNVGDINLTLIAALRQAGLNVEPVILSTRENGLPIEIHPVISDFNYVLAKLNVGKKTYLLDATDPLMPFGMIPFRCFNGKGRVLGNKTSQWMELKTEEKAKSVSTYTVRLDADGYLRGTIANAYYGYDAWKKRREIATAGGVAGYFERRRSQHDVATVANEELQNLADLSKPVIEKFEVAIQIFENLKASHLMFNPFFYDPMEENPFKSRVRTFPVDFGIPIEKTVVLNMELPAGFELTETPAKAAIALPNAGGRYLFSVQKIDNKILMNSLHAINRTVFAPTEYAPLKELYDRIIQIQNQEIVLTKKQ